MKKSIGFCVVASFVSAVVAVCRGSEPVAAEALAGVGGYGETGVCIQDPGCEAGAYVYAGSYTPYEAPWSAVSVPDSLEVLFVNHVGRHGARFLTDGNYTRRLLSELEVYGPLTAVGLRLRELCLAIDSVTANRWGALDALGREEQGGIGRRFAVRYKELLARNDSVSGFSTYVPRCIMSMDEMTHGIAWEDRDVEMSSGSGRRYSALLRPFDADSAYLAYRAKGEWKRVYDAFADTVCPRAVALRLTSRGSRFVERMCSELTSRNKDMSGAFLDEALADTLGGEWPAEWVEETGLTAREATELACGVYKVVAGVTAMNNGAEALPADVFSDWRCYFTSFEYKRLWECENLKHYLTYSANGLSEAPARMAAPLLEELLRTLTEAAQPDYAGPAAIVRFGHAETLMPLYALMDMSECRYVTTDWGNVSEHWMDWNIVPMAANLQLVLCRNPKSGGMYLITYRDERPLGPPEPWDKALRRLRGVLPDGGYGVSAR